MCNLTEEAEKDITTVSAKRLKRKAAYHNFEEIFLPPKRVSPFLNTPTERNEERKKILKISVQKSKEIDNAEQFLRRTVLINNTMKTIKAEIRKNKLKQSRSSRKSVKISKEKCSYNMLSSSMKTSFFYDDIAVSETNEQIRDDMTDTLMKNLEEKLGGRIGNISSITETSTRSSVTPVPWPINNARNNYSELNINQSIFIPKHKPDDGSKPETNDSNVDAFPRDLTTDLNNAQRGIISNDYFEIGTSFDSPKANETTRHDKACSNHLVHQTSNDHITLQNEADCDIAFQIPFPEETSRIAYDVTRFESEIDSELIQYRSGNCNSTEKENHTHSDSVHDIPALPERHLHQSSAIANTSSCSFKVKPNYVLANG